MTEPRLCGIIHDFRGTEYPPCTRPAGHVEAYCHTADGRLFLAHPDEPAAGTDVTALLADNQHLRQQLARAEAVIETAQTTAPALLAEVQLLRAELDRAKTAMRQIRHLHKDSPMGPCPVCIDADAVVAGGDGLMPYPCPTGRLAGAEDCDPPSLRAADEETHVVADSSDDPEHTDDCPGCETAARPAATTQDGPDGGTGR